ncbi:hypothetical protein [Desulfonatronum parangueonense]
MTRTYPKAHKLSVGYNQKEDRLFLIFHLQDGGFRKAFISRRILGALLVRMSKELSASHPNAERIAQRDEVLQMEHVASIFVLTNPAPPAGTHPETDTGSRKAERNQKEQLPSEFTRIYYITAAHLEIQESLLLIGFSGERLNSEKQNPEPIAALALARPEAHQVLRLLRDKADSAGWNVELTAQWMKPLEYGQKLVVN